MSLMGGDTSFEPETDPQLEDLLEYLNVKRAIDFTGYKRTSLTRRIQRRMQSVHVATFSDYLDYLEVHPEEFDLLFNTVLINVTSFFRDEAAWESLAQVIAPLAERQGEPIRAWSAGCATGEEAYTLAILLAEALGESAFRKQVKIYATDIDEEELVKARLGSYSADRVEGIAPELLERYFEYDSGRYTFRSDLRRAVIFGRHNLVSDAPISQLDLLVCRNTLMYFNREVQSRIMARFHFALKEGGALFLGKAETMLSRSELFKPLSLKHRIFTKSEGSLRDKLLILSQAGSEDSGRWMAQEVRLREVGFNSSPEAQLVVDARGRLSLVNERARTLFALSEDDLGRQFQDLKLSYQPAELRTPIDKVMSERSATDLGSVEHAYGGEVLHLDVKVVPLVSNGGNSSGYNGGNRSKAIGASVIFRDVTSHKRLQNSLELANGELETAYEELQSTNEELETTNEELQSTVEELETTNEEMQSTNEELETMNEEMQSTNEELETMNEEMRRRTEEVDRLNSFLESILGSLRAAVVVLDQQLNIYVWNARAEDLWGLRADEVEGHSLFTLDIGLDVEQLKAPVRACLEGKSAVETRTLGALTRRGRTIQCRVTCTSFDSPDNALRGVILLMEEVGDEG